MDTATYQSLNRQLGALARENDRLRDAGDQIIALLSRCSDQATDEQRAEHERFARAIKRIWTDAKNPF